MCNYFPEPAEINRGMNLRESPANLGIDVIQGILGLEPDIVILILERRRKRFNSPKVSEITQGLGSLSSHLRAGIL
jgi:hypothetical protein